MLNKDILVLSGVLNESRNGKIEDFAKKRSDGAKKIADAAKEKGGAALLTYNHFNVKLPYYDKVAKGKFDFDSMKKEYVKLCSELHSYIDAIEKIDQIKFQKLVGKIEALGELLIEQRASRTAS